MGAQGAAVPRASDSQPSTESRKRKYQPHDVGVEETNVYHTNTYAENQYYTGQYANHYDAPEYDIEPPPKKARRPKAPKTEKRLRRFRPHPPQFFLEIYARARTQRFYVLSRTRIPDPAILEPPIELTGSTGNIYTTTIGRQPSCTCPHARGGHQCKHIVYVLERVLRARYALVYQLALLSEEVREVLRGAPEIVGDGSAWTQAQSGRGGGAQGGSAGKRKAVEGDCPICFCEMEEGKRGADAVVWCRAACGQNVHKGCFETWAATKRSQGNREVTCPYCRSAWQGDEDMVSKIRRGGRVNRDGYVNVASELGISGRRDYSSYSPWWSGHSQSYRKARGYY
ncbi:hypothetical protein B0J18DRAFT_463461 [Chaetomium sp. MPI-SDFR-AT-0129]|nr:hypothetical protein B0J18DRAFT_463461 [Chaetomium sp. MPI-SDFR-AT-0129]